MKKKVLLFIPTLEMGGAERQALDFAKYMKLKKYDVAIVGIENKSAGNKFIVQKECDKNDIICMNAVEQDLPKIVMQGAKIYLLLHTKVECDFLFIQCMFGLIHILRNIKYDAIISYCALPGTIVGTVKHLYKQTPKFIWYQRDAGIQNCNEKLQKKAINRADMVLANGISGKNWLYKQYCIDAQIVYNGVERKPAEYSKEQWLQFLGVDTSYKIVSMVANLSSAKDHMTVLRAWDKIIKESSAEKKLLVFAGRFDDKYTEAHDFVFQNELSDSVRFLGGISDVFGLYEASDLCVFSSFSEGNPNAVIEAAMVGLAVVATDLPEIRDVVCADNYRYLFKANNAEDCADKILVLLDNKTFAKDIGEKNQKKALQQFSVEERFRELSEYI